MIMEFLFLIPRQVVKVVSIDIGMPIAIFQIVGMDIGKKTRKGGEDANSTS